MPVHSENPESLTSPLRRLLSRPAGVFWVLLAIYLSTWAGHYTSGDGAIKVDWARGLLFRGSSRLDPAIGGPEEYSFYPIGHTVLAMPALVMSHLTRKFMGVSCEAALYTLLFVANGALLLYLMARYLWPIYGPRRSWITVLVLGLGTLWWPYTKVDFTEPLVATVIFGAFLLLRADRPFLGMLAAGVGWTLRPEAILFAGLLGLWHLMRTRRLDQVALMGLGLIPAAAVNLYANWIRWGSWSSSGYAGGYSQAGFDYPALAGFFGLIFSPGKGLFWFSPPLLLGVLGWNRMRNREATRSDAWFFAALFGLSVALYSRWWDWGSDDAWGVRFLISGVIFMTLPVVEMLDRRLWVGTVLAIGVAVQLLAVLVAPLEYVVMLHEVEPERPAVLSRNRRKTMDLEEMWYHPRYGQLPGHWTLVRVMFGVPPSPSTERQNRFTGLSLYECYPEEAWRRHAFPDLIWWRPLTRVLGLDGKPGPTP